MQLLAAVACLVLAATTSASAADQSRQREILIPQGQNSAMVPLDWSYPPLSELGLHSVDQADRIKSAMARFMADGGGEPRFGPIIQPEIRLRTRSAPSASESQDMFSQLLNSLEADHEKEQRSIHQQPQQQASSSSGSSLKSLRNIQPVFMRLPPRFGKRSMS